MGKRLRLLTLISLVIALATLSRQQHSGMSFQHRGQLVYVANFHQIFVEVKLGGFLQDLTYIDQDLRSLILKVQEMSDNRAVRLIANLKRQVVTIHQRVVDLQITESLLEMSSVVDDNQALADYPTQEDENDSKRNKRGLINGIGSAASYLFGLATSEEIAETNKKVGIIKTSTNQVVAEINKQVSVLQKLGKEITDVWSTTKVVQQQVSEMKMRLLQHRLMEDLLWVQGTLNQLSDKLNLVTLGLHRMKSGKISTEIISLATLKKILTKLKGDNQHLLFNHDEQLALYAEMSRVIQVPAGEFRALRFVILFPLKDMAQTFQLYELIPIPIWNSTLQMGIVYGPVSKYLAVSEDLTTFSLIKTLEECKVNSENYVCPAGPPIYLREHEICEVRLYLEGSKLVPTCPRTIYSIADPVFTRTKTGYAYSVPRPIEITVQCTKKPPTIKTFKIEGVGHLKLQGGCHATGTGFLLVTSNQEIQDVKEIIKFEPFNNENSSLLTNEEFQRFMHEKVLINKHMERRAGTPLEVKQLFNNLDQLKEVEFDKQWNTYSRPGTAVMAVVLLIVLIIVCRLLCKKRKWILKTIGRRIESRGSRADQTLEDPHETTILMNPIVSTNLHTVEIGASLDLKRENVENVDANSGNGMGTENRTHSMTLRQVKRVPSPSLPRNRRNLFKGRLI